METFDSKKELEKEEMNIQIKKNDDDKDGEDEDKYILGQLILDAVECGDLDEVTRIFTMLQESHGAKDKDVDLKNVMNITPLAIASKNNHLPICEFLVENGADINHYVNDSMIGDGVFTGSDYYDTDRTPLIYAAEHGHLDVCEFLVNAGANIELCSSGEEFSPLQFACRAGHLPVCEFLVKMGAKVNNDDNFNPTPLELASYGNHTSICELLIKAGAIEEYKFFNN